MQIYYLSLFSQIKDLELELKRDMTFFSLSLFHNLIVTIQVKCVIIEVPFDDHLGPIL